MYPDPVGAGILIMRNCVATDMNGEKGLDRKLLWETLVTVHLRTCVYYDERLAMNTDGLER